MALNLRQIEVFRAIMITGSISGAARPLSVSQPAISRLLAYTEDRLALRLFERVRGRVQPTPEAKRLFREVEHIHEGVTRVNALAEELRERGAGALRVAASPSVGEALVPEAIVRLRERFANLRVEFEILTLPEVIAKVRAGRADLGVTILPVDEPTLNVEVLAEGRLMAIMPIDHALAAARVVKAADLARAGAFIGFSPQTPYGDLVARALARKQKAPAIDLVVRFTPVACALAQAGAGVAVVDEFVLRGNAWPKIAARPLSPAFTVAARLVTPRFEPLSRTARAFCDLLREIAPRPPGAPASRANSVGDAVAR